MEIAILGRSWGEPHPDPKIMKIVRALEIAISLYGLNIEIATLDRSRGEPHPDPKLLKIVRALQIVIS